MSYKMWKSMVGGNCIWIESIDNGASKAERYYWTDHVYTHLYQSFTSNAMELLYKLGHFSSPTI